MRVLVVDSSSRDLPGHVRDLTSAPGVNEVVVVHDDWSSVVAPGDVIVADYFADKQQLIEAGNRGACWLHILSAGIETFPLDQFEFGTITRSEGISAGPIGEYILAMMLAREKLLADLLCSGHTQGSLGELAGRTLGVFGMGAIGSHAARLALAFGMNVVGMRRSARALPRELHQVNTVDHVADLVAAADHIAISAPLTAATRHVFNDATLRHAKPTAHIINIARGGLIDTDALLRALDNGTLAYATLDVTDPEPLPADHPLRCHPRVTLTPHLAGRAAAAEGRNWGVFVANLGRFHRGESLVGLVDRDGGY
jgi:phosphoglycerate dehydrogenase-like enzyme